LTDLRISRCRGGSRRSPLPDFYIGAHAVILAGESRASLRSLGYVAGAAAAGRRGAGIE